MGFVDIKVRERFAPHRGQTVCVYSPADVSGRICASSRDQSDWLIAADGAGCAALSELAMLAAGKSGGIVYWPKVADRPRWLDESYPACDLVLCHHSLQLAPAAWKEMRGRLAAEKTRTVSIQEPDREFEHPGRYAGDEAADVFDLTQQARTVFLTGSEAAFRSLAKLFSWLGNATETGDHSHLFDLARDERRHGQAGDLTAVYTEPKDWASK